MLPLFFAKTALGGEEGNGCLEPGHELLEMVNEWGNDRIQRNLDVEVKLVSTKFHQISRC
jgi:hypothetical protein